MEKNFQIKEKMEMEKNMIKARKREEMITKNTRMWFEEIIPSLEKQNLIQSVDVTHSPYLVASSGVGASSSSSTSSAAVVAETSIFNSNKRIKKLWRLGLPPKLRSRLWPLVINNTLNINRELYNVYVRHFAKILEKRKKADNIFKAYERAEREHLTTAEAEENGDESAAAAGNTGSDEPASPSGGYSASGGHETHNTASGNEITLNNSLAPSAAEDMINLDLPRTFPNLKFFAKDTMQYNQLKEVLTIYTLYRTDIGYIQGMSYIAATLLLYLDPYEAFYCFANIINHAWFQPFFTMDLCGINAYMNTFAHFMHENLPQVHANFARNNITPQLYLFDWVVTLFSRSFPIELVSRLWDNFLIDGHLFIIRTSIAILHHHREIHARGNMDECLAEIGRSGEIKEDDLFESLNLIKIKKSKLESVYEKELALERERNPQ